MSNPELKSDRPGERWPLARLKPHPAQEIYFGDLHDNELEALKESLVREGQLQPIECLPCGTVLCGHQRWRAARELGWNEVDVWVREDLAHDSTAAEERLIRDNFTRRQLTPLQLARCLAGLKQLQGVPGQSTHRKSQQLRDEIGKQFGLSGRMVDRYLLILKAPRIVQEAFDQGRLSLVAACRVALLSPEKQTEIAAKITQEGLAGAKRIVNEAAPERSGTRGWSAGMIARQAITTLAHYADGRALNCVREDNEQQSVDALRVLYRELRGHYAMQGRGEVNLGDLLGGGPPVR